MNYAIRISRSYEQIQEVVVQIINKSKNVVAFEHPADNQVKRTHVHLLVVECEVSTDTLKNWFKKRLGDVNKTDWSFKTAQSQLEEMTQYMVYCSKGKYDPRFNNLVTPEAMEELKAKWVDPKTLSVKLKDGKLVKDVDDAANISKRKIVEEIVTEVGDIQPDTRRILAGIRKVLVRHNCVVGQYKVMDYYDSYMMYAQKEVWLDVLASRIEKRDSR